MVLGRESNFDKAVKTINDFEKKGKLLTTRVISEEAGVGGKYLQELKDKLRSYSVADFVNYRGAEYWFTTRRLTELDREKLLQWIENTVVAEQREQTVKDHKAKEKLKQEFLSERKMHVAKPMVKCKCGTELDATSYFQHGSIYFSKVGTDSLAGSVTCPKCSIQVFYGVIDYQLTDKFPDTTLQEALALGFSKEELLPNKELNRLFTDINRGETFVFCQK